MGVACDGGGSPARRGLDILPGRGVWVLRLFVRRGGPSSRCEEADRELRGEDVSRPAKPFGVDLDRPLEVAGRGRHDEGARDLRSSSKSHRAVRRGLRWSRKGSGARNTRDDLRASRGTGRYQDANARGSQAGCSAKLTTTAFQRNIQGVAVARRPLVHRSSPCPEERLASPALMRYPRIILVPVTA